MEAWQICLIVFASLLSGGGAAVAFVWFNNSLLTVKRFSFESKKAGGKVRIVQLSDLHGKSFSRGNRRLIKRVKALAPDVICVTGDIIHNYKPKGVERAVALVRELAAVCPVLYVSGNHEMRNKGYREFRQRLAEAGARVLDDRAEKVCGVTFVGVNCASLKNGTPARLLEECERAGEDCRVLLAHMPHCVQNYKGYDLVLSGHAHGGQWRIPFTKVGIYAPGQGLFPKYTAGVYREHGTVMLVSRGLGNSQFPLRLFNPPQIVVAEICESSVPLERRVAADGILHDG